MIAVAQFHLIKFLAEREGLSQREIARKLQISRNTVAKYLQGDTAPTAAKRRQVYAHRRYSAEVEHVIPLIDQWLKEDQQVWKKQRHTAARIYRRLRDEYGFTGSESNIRKVVAQRRAQQQEVFIPNWDSSFNLIGARQMSRLAVRSPVCIFSACNCRPVARSLFEPTAARNRSRF
ncbi:helix-turn-helix domain-containing protein [Kyrpidia spormannii]|uniref:HTH cro/C1-type domain-containing protein n=1 Tax=Kyrpidia spormannii TaxID=2055160 RepID=A0A6F9E1M5_9BACL|nr:helix-turn-helix domain-containing protein [Kyrpidia spormannii]CAB3390404.1 protein of unknown function [Kyrpidia spormannii]